MSQHISQINSVILNIYNNLIQRKIYVNTATLQDIQLPIISLEEEGFIKVGGTLTEYRPLYCETLIENTKLVEHFSAMGENQSKPTFYNTPPPVNQKVSSSSSFVPYPLGPSQLPPRQNITLCQSERSSDSNATNRINPVYRDVPFKLASLLEASSETKSTDDFDALIDTFQNLVSNSNSNYHYDFSLERGVIRNNAS